MAFAPGCRPSAGKKCWQIGAPRAASACPPDETCAAAVAIHADPATLSGLDRQPVRLKRRAEFLLVAKLGRKAPVHGLVLQALRRDDAGPARIGFTVTKKVGNAVVRNRTKRRLREAARLLLRDAPISGVDLVLIGRDTTRARPFALLIDDLQRALSKTGAVSDPRPGRTSRVT